MECVDEICCLGDVICVKGYMEASSIGRIRNGWKKFQEFYLHQNGISYQFYDYVYNYSVCKYRSEIDPENSAIVAILYMAVQVDSKSITVMQLLFA